MNNKSYALSDKVKFIFFILPLQHLASLFINNHRVRCRRFTKSLKITNSDSLASLRFGAMFGAVLYCKNLYFGAT